MLGGLREKELVSEHDFFDLSKIMMQRTDRSTWEGGWKAYSRAPAIYAPGAPTATQAARAGRPAHRKIGARSRSSP